MLRNLDDYPLISIVVSFRNESKNIEKCLESLLRLDYPKKKFEIIVIDDGSTDDSLEIINRFTSDKLTQTRLEVLRQEWKGTAVARNYGIENSKGEIIVLIDADAVADEKLLKEFSTAFREKGADMVGGQIREVYSMNEVHENKGRLIHEKTFWFTNFAFRRQMVENIGGFDRRFRRGSDPDFILRALDAGFKAYYHSGAVVWHVKPPSKSFLKNARAELRNGKADILLILVNTRKFLKPRNLKEFPLSFKVSVANTLGTLFLIPLLLGLFLLGGTFSLFLAAVYIPVFLVGRMAMSKIKKYGIVRAFASFGLSTMLWIFLFRSLPLAFHRKENETRLIVEE